MMTTAKQLIEDPVLAKIAAGMKKVPGIVAMGLGGSRSIGTAMPDSDYDVIMFIEREPDLDQDKVASAIAGFGGRWTGNLQKPLAQMSIDDRKVELFFRSFGRYDQELELARKGGFRRTLNPLHSIGFLSTIVISYVTYARSFWDPDDKLAQAIERAYPYPDVLRNRMIATFRTEAKLALIHASKVNSIHDVAHLTGLYVRAIAAWNLLLFAINGRYPIIDKGGRQVVAALPDTVRQYDFRTKAIIRAASAGDLQGALGAANRVHNEICEFAKAFVPDRPQQLVAAQ